MRWNWNKNTTTNYKTRNSGNATVPTVTDGYKITTVAYNRTTTTPTAYTNLSQKYDITKDITEDISTNIYDVTATTTTIKPVPPDQRFSQSVAIHHGTRANQAINIHIEDMHTRAMGLTDAAVTTRENATNAIGKIDAAIDYELDEATTIGATINRLLYTAANLTTANENTKASESTIRDADMAKAMTDYTKSNVLAQAAQTMLAQANQDASSGLSLLP